MESESDGSGRNMHENHKEYSPREFLVLEHRTESKERDCNAAHGDNNNTHGRGKIISCYGGECVSSCNASDGTPAELFDDV